MFEHDFKDSVQWQRADSDPTVTDASAKAEKFAQRYTEILEDLKKDPESQGGPPDCIVQD
ncbi:hypothetical protein ZOSMA_3G00750 [Zostera marina]|uniref:Uncharacterized protein n=1 Tax=Zostera marina TaxID=29655 RepID=A0A0K9P3N1_ZOSMR|nr:hypothetical protein ZOSMA_3G00750 [Zostera marina]